MRIKIERGFVQPLPDVADQSQLLKAGRDLDTLIERIVEKDRVIVILAVFAALGWAFFMLK